MAFVKTCLKEIVESGLRSARRFAAQSSNTEVNSALRNDGLIAIPSFYSSEHCKKLRDKIDSYIESSNSNVWKDECGADNRVYFINEIDEDFNDFYKHPEVRKALKDYTGITNPKGMLLAARIDAKEGNVGSGGGWHRDSPITHQFKAICYLSEVSPSSGPFQYVKSSHTKYSVFKSYLGNVLKPGKYRFSNDEVENYVSTMDQGISEVTGSEGTLAFVDTKTIHRGKPIECGSRYVLFCYFWANEIPEHFNKLRQS